MTATITNAATTRASTFGHQGSCPRRGVVRPSSVALVIVQSSKMPRAFRLMTFELEWFEGKPLPPSFHVLRRSVGTQSALDWTR